MPALSHLSAAGEQAGHGGVEGSGVFPFMRCLQGVVGGDAHTSFLLTPGPRRHSSVQQSLFSAAVILYYSAVLSSNYLNLGT